MMRNPFCICLAFLATIAVVGCAAPKHDMAAMKDMKPPPRPAELDRLNAWVGTWEGTGEMKVPGDDKPMTTSGKSIIAWEAGDRVVIERADFTMGEMDPMKGVGMYTWDPKAKVYRSWWFDNWGTIGTGTMNYDESKKTWNMKWKGTDPMTGDGTCGEGSVVMPDDKTMKWNWTEWDSWKFQKKMEGSGTSTKM